MSIFNSNSIPQSLFLAGSLSLLGGTAQAQAPAASDLPQGRAGIATLCIEKRSYVDPQAKKIVTPTIYIDKMPSEGIDTGYVEGNPAAVRWKEFLNPTDPVRKKWLDDTDIPDQANAAFDLVKKLDKDKNGIITVAEFEKGEKGKSEEDRNIDLAFLTSLRCDNLYFTQGALNTVDVNAFPEVVSLQSDLAALRSDLEASKTSRAQTEKKANFYQLSTSVLGGLLALGLVVALKRRKFPAEPKAEVKPETKLEPKPEPKKDEKETAPKADAKEPGDLDDVLDELAAVKSTPPPLAPAPVVATPDNVLIEGADAKPVAGVTAIVLKAQILLHFSHLNDPAFAHDVDKLVDVLVIEYNELIKRNPENLEELWQDQKSEGIPLVRRGVPQIMLLGVARQYIEAETGAGSPFVGGLGEDILREAQRRTVDVDLAKGLPEILRRLGR